ncbi:hypothetical protein TCAL_15108 [Tigriopus californicus]|uniref:Uncharacterized protein n=1 Tax=Tigriopus californicus TaxID=6832 RepID=A0A553NTG9_TIGCA|nr:hypothetical protein TCAL_15108 [Tigriopus californicus]
MRKSGKDDEDHEEGGGEDHCDGLRREQSALNMRHERPSRRHQLLQHNDTDDHYGGIGNDKAPTKSSFVCGDYFVRFPGVLCFEMNPFFDLERTHPPNERLGSYVCSIPTMHDCTDHNATVPVDNDDDDDDYYHY